MKKVSTIFLWSIVLGLSVLPLDLPAQEYLATTRWVAAIAECAGLPHVENFAPSGMTHPPEYELKPTDIAAFSKAQAVFFAGYEGRMVAKIQEALKGGANFKAVQVVTENSLQNLKSEAERIAVMFGTVPVCTKNIAELEQTTESIRDALKAKGLFGANAYVHVHQVPFAQTLGFTIAGTFGPAPVSAEQIRQAAELKPAIIIDNYHNIVGKPLVEVSKASRYVAFLNFPGLFQTESILDVFRYNERQLLSK